MATQSKKKNPTKKSSTKSSHSKKVNAVESAEAPRVRVKEEDFMKRLTEKLTHFDASLVLEAAMISAGLNRPHQGFFRKEETREICLQLIKRGGPAFSVGTGIYREVIG